MPRPGLATLQGLSLRPRLALAALVCAAGMAWPIGLRPALAADCAAGAASPGGAAGAAALYGELSDTVSAEPLSVDITAKSIGGACTWVYQVKVLTVSGSVALLDFDLVDLDLKQVEGSPTDPEVAKLMERLKDRESETEDGATGGKAGSRVKQRASPQ